MSKQPLTIAQADRAILHALSRYHYLTAAQAGRLLYPNLTDENRHIQRRLKKLTDTGYVLRLRALPTPRYGQAPHVFTLARLGRQYLTALGIAVKPYFRPSEEARATQNNPFMEHRLAAIDVMIAADCLCRDYPVSCQRMLSERELKHEAVRVNIPPRPRASTDVTRRVAVIPDAWFQLSVAGQPPISIALELDRATEDQLAWRRKVAALAIWAEGPYREAFATDNLTVAVVTPGEPRRDTLADWTLRELEERDFPDLAEIFLFTATSPLETPPFSFFFDSHWYLPQQRDPVALLDAPPETVRKEVPVFAP